jgi:hypothetical protein
MDLELDLLMDFIAELLSEVIRGWDADYAFLGSRNAVLSIADAEENEPPC